MAFIKGFDDVVTIEGRTILTCGDINYGSQFTDIPVKTRASQKIRHIDGMEDNPITLQVLSGTDPEDSNSVNGYDLLLAAHEGRSPVRMTIGDLSDTFLVMQFNRTAPVDGLKAADVTLAVSGREATSSGS